MSSSNGRAYVVYTSLEPDEAKRFEWLKRQLGIKWNSDLVRMAIDDLLEKYAREEQEGKAQT